MLKQSIRDPVGVRGEVFWAVRDGKTGRFVHTGRIRNKTNNWALSTIVQWMTGTPNVASLSGSVPLPTQMQLGTGTGVPSAADTSLFTPAAGTVIGISNFAVYQTYYAQYLGFWNSSTPAGNYSEADIIDANGNLWGHVLLQTSASQPYIPIQAGQTLTVVWKFNLLGN